VEELLREALLEGARLDIIAFDKIATLTDGGEPR
jgi:hypothetical protein